jgi:hypothetical protein
MNLVCRSLLPLLLCVGCFNPTGSADVDSGTDTAGETGIGDSSSATVTSAVTGMTGGPAMCGNGTVEDGEECDLGPGNADDGSCTTQCLMASCGDGLVHAGAEACDDGEATAQCDADCTAVECGDGTVNAAAGESCDGGEPTNGVCDDACTLVCDQGWDDCNRDPGDGCELPVADDPANCGACGNVCETCRSGYCDAKYAFLTSEVYFGDFGGVAAADSACQGLADAAGLSGTYMAWVSSGSDQVVDRFSMHDGPYIRVDGEKVADDWADLTDGTLDTAITKTETGENPTAPGGGITCHGGAACLSVMTATQEDGTAYVGQHDDCDGWTNQSVAFAGGDPSNPVDDWSLYAIGLRCDYASRLYCFEQ